MAIQTINPATGKAVKSFDELTKEKVSVTIDHVHNTFLSWKESSFDIRSKLMFNAAEVLREKKAEFGKTLTLEMGKPISQAIAEVEKCAWVCDYYADNAEKILSNEVIKTDASESFVQFDPLGIILAVMPWNFPFWQVFRFAAPALMAGNVGLLKHASNVPMSALAIEQVFLEAGFPENTFKTLLIGSGLVEDIINNPKVKAATLTGSEIAGKKVAEACGTNLKKTVMELGGSDPFIILTDADLDQAIETAVTARLINNGQSCIAAKRFIIVEEMADEFEKMFVEKMKSVIIGDPMNESTVLGPIAREDLLNELDTQVKKSVEMGAVVLAGGERLQREGYYYPATVLTNVLPGMPAYEQELFGPVAAVIRAKNVNDAIRIANNTKFGLGASLWTKDIEKAKQIAKEIESGSVFVNGLVKSDPRLPFGGVKVSGTGESFRIMGLKNL